MVYGGAAGGGKSWALLAEGCRHRNNPLFRGIIFRRTYRQIQAPGALLDESRRLYPQIGGTWVGSRQMWEWRTGAALQFSHLQHPDDVYNHQGAQYAFTGWDELTHFDSEQFWYLVSRLRSLSGVRPYIRATCNPAPGWVREWLAPWVQQGYDGPGGRAASGEVRRFVRRSGEIVWLVGGEEAREGERPLTCTFISANIYDNQRLLDANPEYLAALMSLPDIDRRRLLEGDWDVFEGAFFDEWAEHRHAVTPPYQPGDRLPGHWRFYGGFDWGYRSPCAAVLGAVDEYNCLHVLDSFKAASLTNEAQSDKLLTMCAKWQVPASSVLFGADPAMWARKTINGMQGEADIEAFHRAGLMMSAANNTRRGERSGWSPIRRMLHAPNAEDGYSSAFRVWRGHNAELIRQFPLWQFEDDGEDMDTSGDDHLADALRYLVVTRPAGRMTPEMEAQRAAEEAEAERQAWLQARYAPDKVRQQRKTDY